MGHHCEVLAGEGFGLSHRVALLSVHPALGVMSFQGDGGKDQKPRWPFQHLSLACNRERNFLAPVGWKGGQPLRPAAAFGTSNL